MMKVIILFTFIFVTSSNVMSASNRGSNEPEIIREARPTDLLKDKFSKNSDEVTSNGPMRALDRWYIYNKILAIFGSTPGVKSILSNRITPYAPFFGGACNIYDVVPTNNDGGTIRSTGQVQFYYSDGLFKCYSERDITTKHTTVSNVARQGLHAQVCYDLIEPKQDNSQTTFVDNVLEKICDEEGCSASTQEMRNIYQLFYPYMEPSDDELEGIKTALEGVSSDSDREILEFFLYAVCIEPYWLDF